jgi:hypothetical protein
MTGEMRWLIAGLWLSLIAGCSNEGSPSGSGGGGSGGSGGSAAKPAAGGGFSADLAKELASASGSGSGGGAAKAGDGSGGAAAVSGDGSAKAMAGSGDGSAKAMAGSGDGSAKAMGSGDGSAAKAGEGSAAKAGEGSAAKAGEGAAKAGEGSAKAGEGSAKAPEPPKVSTGPGPVIQSSGTAPKRVVVPPELAAIKLSLLPNWERDVQDAGTISLGVKIPGRTDSAVFVFRYGYEDSSAPAERDAYKKWLAEKKILVIRQDRQAGAAWFLEGTDGSGNAAFRVIVSWGGRKLVCYGSLYKDAASNKLGDLRDQTIIQAKQICETVAL